MIEKSTFKQAHILKSIMDKSVWPKMENISQMGKT